MRAALYARVSTKEQAQGGYSLRDQIRALREYCQQQNYQIVAEIEDRGHSGSTLDRPGMDRVRDMVVAGGVDIVLAQDADRITRDPGDRYILDSEAEKHAAKWVALDDWGDDSHEGQLLRFIHGWKSKGERQDIARRMQRGKRQRAREGKVVPAGRAPYGFSYDPATCSYQIAEQDMRLVRRIFDMAARGTSLHRIKRVFESEGIRTPGSTHKPEGSKFWNVNTIRRIILNDVYSGEYHYNKTSRNGASIQRSLRPREEWISIPVPQSGVSKEQIEQARANLKGEKQSRADNRFWELSGYAFCACGCKLISKVTHKAGRKYPYYVCTRHTRDGCPHGKWRNADKLEADVYRALQQIKPQDLEGQIQELINRERAPESEIKAEYAVLEDVARQRAKFQQMAARDLITLDELEVHLAELTTRKESAERRLEILQNTTERIEKLKLIQKNPILRFVGQTTDQRRDYYDGLELRVETDKDSVVVKGIFGCQNVAPTSTSPTRR